MAHIIILMDGCLDSMRGNATTGGLVALKTAYHALDAHLAEMNSDEDVENAHTLLESIQAFLCDGGTFDGAGSQVATFTTQCNALL